MRIPGIIAVLRFLLSVFPPAAPARGAWSSSPDTLEIRDMTLRGDILWCAANGGIDGDRPNPFTSSAAFLSGPMSAGVHSAVWDGRDAAGRTVSSEVYIACLRMGKITVSHRMMMAK